MSNVGKQVTVTNSEKDVIANIFIDECGDLRGIAKDGYVVYVDGEELSRVYNDNE